MKKLLLLNTLLAAAYASVGATALIPPATHTERALGICLIVLSCLFWLASRDCAELVETNRETLRQTIRLCDLDDTTRAELTRILEDSK